MPSMMTLFGCAGRTARAERDRGLHGRHIGLAGFAFLLAFIRALAQDSAIGALRPRERVSRSPGLLAFLFGWIGAFYLGELLLGSRCCARARRRGGSRARCSCTSRCSRWPSLLPDEVQSLTALLITVALCGVGITANQNAAKVPIPV